MTNKWNTTELALRKRQNRKVELNNDKKNFICDSTSTVPLKLDSRLQNKFKKSQKKKKTKYDIMTDLITQIILLLITVITTIIVMVT